MCLLKQNSPAIVTSRLVTFLFIAFLLSLWPVRVSANGAPSADYLPIYLYDLSENVAYADILIDISESDQQYTALNVENLEELGLSSTCDMVTYSHKGFRSFTFHYANAASTSRIYHFDNDYGAQAGIAENGEGQVIFCRNTEFQHFYTQFEDLQRNYSNFYLAFYDYNGNFISHSNIISLPRIDSYITFGGIIFNYQTGNIEIKTDANFYIIIAEIFLFVPLIVSSVLIEIFTAIFFGFRKKKLLLVFSVNLISQILMRIAYITLMFTSIPYLLIILFLEAVVYLAEFFAYRNATAMRDENKTKILTYTVLSNTLSLVVFIFINRIIA